MQDVQGSEVISSGGQTHGSERRGAVETVSLNNTNRFI